ncbi:MAG: IclR family transcriptional regulator [Thermodesulfobacteriota bacterium]
MESNYSAPSVKKAFIILKAIADSTGGLGVSELGKTLNIGKSTVLGITRALEELGVLGRNPTRKKFTLGYTLIDLGKKALSKIERMTVTAQASMESLMGELEETVFLGIMHGDHAVILKVVESPQELKITAPAGSRVPLLAGALGRVFLAQLDETKVKGIVQKKGLKKYTANSITDFKKFFREVQETKNRGYSVDTDEYMSGVTAVAAPIYTPFLPPAAIWVVGFSPTFRDQKLEKAIIEIQKASIGIGRLLLDYSK